MTHLTLFLLGDYSIPFSTVRVDIRMAGGRGDSYLADMEILNCWFDRKEPANDKVFTIRNGVE